MEPRRTFEEIKTLYPDEWVYLLSPEYEGNRVKEGVVLAHHPDKRTAIDLAIQAKSKINEGRFTLAYAGNLIPRNSSWIRSTRLI